MKAIPELGRELVDTLSEARRKLDPEGRDPAFDRIILVGHGLGGLVARSPANALGPQPAEADGPGRAEQGWSARHRVGRIIFVATPHRGAPIDRGVMQSVGARVARSVSPSIAARQAGGVATALPPATSVDQLGWDHPFLLELEGPGSSSGVHSHSTLAGLGAPGIPGATDGLVPVARARLAGAQSGLAVRAPHACFQHPELIQGLRKVLGEHALGPVRAQRSEVRGTPSAEHRAGARLITAPRPFPVPVGEAPGHALHSTLWAVDGPGSGTPDSGSERHGVEERARASAASYHPDALTEGD